MQLVVEFLAQAKVAAGVPADRIELEEALPPAALLRRLVESHPGLAGLVGDGGRKGSMLLFVDDQQVDWDDPGPIAGGARVLITSAMSGG